MPILSGRDQRHRRNSKHESYARISVPDEIQSFPHFAQHLRHAKVDEAVFGWIERPARDPRANRQYRPVLTRYPGLGQSECKYKDVGVFDNASHGREMLFPIQTKLAFTGEAARLNLRPVRVDVPALGRYP